MAIEFKSAPVSKAAGESTTFDIFTLVGENGQLSIVLLVISVAVIYAIVTYLKTTPGYRVSDIKVKRRRDAQGDAAAVQRRSAPPVSAEEPVEQT